MTIDANIISITLRVSIVSVVKRIHLSITEEVFDGSRFANIYPVITRRKADWRKIIWVLVFQVFLVQTVINLLTWILSARWCPLSFSLSKTSLALSILQSVSTSVCVMAIIEFGRRTAADLQGTKTTSKLVSFKGIVGITLTQTPAFAIIATYGLFKRTIYVSTLDFTVGTPAFMTCCEMFMISIVFLWTFTADPYLELRGTLPRCRTISSALLEVLDIRDILKGYWYMTKIIFCCGGDGNLEDIEDYEEGTMRNGK